MLGPRLGLTLFEAFDEHRVALFRGQPLDFADLEDPLTMVGLGLDLFLDTLEEHHLALFGGELFHLADFPDPTTGLGLDEFVHALEEHGVALFQREPLDFADFPDPVTVVGLYFAGALEKELVAFLRGEPLGVTDLPDPFAVILGRGLAIDEDQLAGFGRLAGVEAAIEHVETGRHGVAVLSLALAVLGGYTRLEAEGELFVTGIGSEAGLELELAEVFRQAAGEAVHEHPLTGLGLGAEVIHGLALFGVDAGLETEDELLFAGVGHVAVHQELLTELGIAFHLHALFESQGAGVVSGLVTVMELGFTDLWGQPLFETGVEHLFAGIGADAAEVELVAELGVEILFEASHELLVTRVGSRVFFLSETVVEDGLAVFTTVFQTTLEHLLAGFWVVRNRFVGRRLTGFGARIFGDFRNVGYIRDLRHLAASLSSAHQHHHECGGDQQPDDLHCESMHLPLLSISASGFAGHSHARPPRSVCHSVTPEASRPPSRVCSSRRARQAGRPLQR